MKLKLTTDSLAYTLLGEMQEVLGLLERGNTGRAFRLLEARCRPRDPMKRMPRCFGDPAARLVLTEMLALIPKPFLRAPYRFALEIAASMVAQATTKPGWIDSAECSLGTSMILAHWGLVLHFDEDDELNIDAEIAELIAKHSKAEADEHGRH